MVWDTTQLPITITREQGRSIPSPPHQSKLVIACRMCTVKDKAPRPFVTSFHGMIKKHKCTLHFGTRFFVSKAG